MRIAIIMSGQAIEPGGGVRMQGIMWRDGLNLLGHEVDLINFWESYDWKTYNAIIVLQMVGQFGSILKLICKNNPNVFFAPILDPGPSATIKRYHFLAKTMNTVRNSRIGRILHLSSPFMDFYQYKNYAKGFLVRSKQEMEYVSKCFDIPLKKISLVPLSLRFTSSEQTPEEKENFCLHVSRLASPNKNVERLVQAAKKYSFNLKLVGYLHGDAEKQWMKSLIGDSNNIEYVGSLDDDELKKYYRRAKVFALPSYVEGVGMVAMEAASYGCEIVLTNMGAPKDYYNGMAELVDPFSVDEIGIAIVKCLKEGNSQPKLMEYIKNEYSLESCSKKLEVAIGINN